MNKEKRKAYLEAYFKAYSKAYKEAHKEELTKYKKEHPKTHKEKKNRKEYDKKYRESATYKYKNSVHCQKRIAQKKNSEGNGITPEQWNQIKEETGQRCVYCCEKNEHLHMEHVVPISRCGRHDVDNIVPACKSCNSSKNAKSLLMFLYDRN